MGTVERYEVQVLRMESEPNANNSAAESATGIGADGYIGDVNVVILERNIAKFNASLCAVDRFQTETTSFLSKYNDKIKDLKVADNITDTTKNKDVDGNISINIGDEVPRKANPCNGDEIDILAKCTDTGNDRQYLGIRTMFAKEDVSSMEETQTEPSIDWQHFDIHILLPIEEARSTVVGVTDTGVQNLTGTWFLNDLYEREVDIKSHFRDEEILDIRTAVDQQVKLFVKTIGEIDPRLRIREVIPAGSSREGTNIVRPCEYDYILVMEAFSKPGTVSLTLPEEYLKEVSLEFVHVKLEHIELRSLFHEIIYNHDEILACRSFPLKMKQGLKDLFNVAMAMAVKLCLNESVEKITGRLTCKSSKPEQHGPACTVMLEWYRKYSAQPLKISVDLCQALKIPWEVYEKFLQSNDCDVSCDFKTRIQNVGSILLMPNSVKCAFKVTFTEAELLLTAELSEHHLKCYKLLKYITQIEIQPFQSYTRKLKYFFQNKSFFPSYALKIMIWNHQFTKHCFEDKDICSCVIEMLSNFDGSSLEEDSLKHPANRNVRVKIVADGSGGDRLWSHTNKRIPVPGPHRLDLWMPELIQGLKRIQKVSIGNYDYEECRHNLHVYGYCRYSNQIWCATTYVIGLVFLCGIALYLYYDEHY